MLLSSIIFSPLLGALVVGLLPSRNHSLQRQVAMAFSFLNVGLACMLLTAFNGEAGMQMTESRAWIPRLGIGYKLGVDGISVFLVALNALLTPIALSASWKSVTDKLKAYLVLLLILQAAVHGVFLALDVFLFYIFWEASLIPMYFLVGVWGGEQRIYATIKFVLYTLLGSLLMLVAIVFMALHVREALGHLTFDLAAWSGVAVGLEAQKYLFLAFFLSFAIKVPLFPLHTWLPDAHVQAPTAGSIILAGVLLKMGTYGILRFCQPLFSEAMVYYQSPIVWLSLVGIVYGAAMVLVQEDFKKMVAYSSVSHMGICVLGLFSFNLAGQQGGLLTMINHGISTGALFLIVGFFYERIHSRDLAKYGGAVHKMPILGLLFLPVAMSSMGVPGTNGFVNEFLAIWGAFKASPAAGAIAASAIILGAAYMLRMTQRVMLGELGSELMEKLTDLDRREIATLGVLVLLIFVLGVFPDLILVRTEAALLAGLSEVMPSQLALLP